MAVARNTQRVVVRRLLPGDLVVLSNKPVWPGMVFQCQTAAVQAKPTFQDVQFSGRFAHESEERAATTLQGLR
jgi:hypothetical protein